MNMRLSKEEYEELTGKSNFQKKCSFRFCLRVIENNTVKTCSIFLKKTQMTTLTFCSSPCWIHSYDRNLVRNVDLKDVIQNKKLSDKIAVGFYFPFSPFFVPRLIS